MRGQGFMVVNAPPKSFPIKRHNKNRSNVKLPSDVLYLLFCLITLFFSKKKIRSKIYCHGRNAVTLNVSIILNYLVICKNNLILIPIFYNTLTESNECKSMILLFSKLQQISLIKELTFENYSTDSA